MGQRNKASGKADESVDKLHVLNEEFAQAILFKKKELMQQQD